jgi:TRAP-type C4-dicarboxylate transport system permease large subunit
VQLAEVVWPNYAAELRQDPGAPDCDLAALDQRVASCTPAAAPAPAAPAADPFADPFASGGAAPDAGPSCEAIRALRGECAARHQAHDSALARITPSLRAFRSVELFVSSFAQFPFWKEMLALAVLLGALATTVQRNHIGLREARQRTEHAASQLAQLAAHLCLFAATVADWRVQNSSAAAIEHGAVPVIWSIGFLALAAVNGWHLLRPPPLEDVPTTATRVALTIPLYTYMTVFSQLYFVLVENHPSGMAIYLHKFLQTPEVYMGVALYVWAGMLLAETRITSTALDVLMPWKLPVWALAWIIVVVSAFPTAYSGASGIFVLAAGAVIFRRLRAAGADPRLALAATAMSGSLGVVLRPCLVVVLITLLNKQVTTADLYGWGWYVYLLTSALFLLALIWRRPQRFSIAAASEAGPPSLQAVRALVPYVLIGAAVVLFYRWPLGTVMSEHTAAVILPAWMLVELIYDRRTDPSGDRAVLKPVRRATSETSVQVGALLIFMAASVAFGGMIERTEVVELAPQQFGSLWAAMAFLVLAMIIIGMLTDVLGGVVLVSATLAPLAYRNGLDPVHFWVMVMCAFELAYLTPPVALNQLLARQVVGAEAHVEDLPVEGGWFARGEHIYLPVVVMGTALLIVAFVPLLFYTAGP